MFSQIDTPLISSMLKRVRYTPDSAVLEVEFQNGAWRAYNGVPAWRVRGLLLAKSKGRYFRLLFGRYDHAASQEEDGLERVVYSDHLPLVAKSIDTIRGHAPDAALPFIERLLLHSPSIIQVVRKRKTRLGTCQTRLEREHTKITVNEGMNPFQTLLTTLHEIAHAKVAWRSVLPVKPHGPVWKTCFTKILIESLEENLFPDVLVPHIRRYSINPLRGSNRDAKLQQAMKAFDSGDDQASSSNLGSSLILGQVETQANYAAIGKSMSEAEMLAAQAALSYLINLTLRGFHLQGWSASQTFLAKTLSEVRVPSLAEFAQMHELALLCWSQLSPNLQFTVKPIAVSSGGAEREDTSRAVSLSPLHVISNKPEIEIDGWVGMARRVSGLGKTRSRYIAIGSAMTEQQKLAALEAIRYLASGSGFSRAHSGIGRRLATVESPTPPIVALMRDMALNYKSYLPAELVFRLGVET